MNIKATELLKYYSILQVYVLYGDIIVAAPLRIREIATGEEGGNKYDGITGKKSGT